MRKYIYTGVFFQFDEIRKDLDFYCTSNRLAKVIEHPHVTFTYKPDEVHPELFGREVVFRVVGYANDGKNQGIKVKVARMATDLLSEYETIKVPHITISVSADGKPVDTANLHFEDIEETFCIAGRYGAYDGKEYVFRDPDCTVRDFCRYRTDTRELVVITQGGYTQGCVWIDSEDLCAIPECLEDEIVKNDYWDYLSVIDSHGSTVKIPAHYIEI